MMKSLTFSILLAFGLFWVATQVIAAEKTSPKAPPSVPAQFNIGGLLYGKFCSSCHGVDLNGTEQGPPFLHRVYHPGHHADGSFFLAAKRGVRAHHWKFGNMPPVEGIDENMVGAIVEYIRHVQKSAGLF
jgi:mono/diheme cytochrome c family protein